MRWLAGHGAIKLQFRPPGGAYDDEGLERRASEASNLLDRPPVEWIGLLRELRGSANDRTTRWEAALVATADLVSCIRRPPARAARAITR